jgi:outer membrane protein TolC
MDCQRTGPRVPAATDHPSWRSRTLSFLTATALLTGCCGYQCKPLEESALLERVHEARRPAAYEGRPLTLAEATELMRRNNPDIREARAAWRVEEAVAKVRTPLANPEIGVGPFLFGGGDILSGSWGSTGFFGWTVPLTGIQRLTDQVNRVRADAALAQAAVVERQAYLGLRAAYLQAGLRADLEQLWESQAAVARAAVDMGSRMLEAGQSSAVDVSLLRLDAARAEADTLDAAEQAMSERQALAARINVHADLVAPPAEDARPPLPSTIPALERLEALAVAGHPELARRRADYLLREKEFRIEVRRQTPDPGIGLNYQYDEVHELGLPVGIKLPVFDRNQPTIQRTYEAREASRERYRAELGRLLSRISAARALVETRGRTHARYTAGVAPEAARTLETTRQALRAGATGALSYFAVLSTTRAASIDALRARNDHFAAWLELEAACGVPILAFPNAPGSEPAAMAFPAPPAPPPLAPQADAATNNTNEKEGE